MKEIKLTRGKVAIVDDADFEWLNQRKWTARPSVRSKVFYAVRKEGGKQVYMHRLILGLTDRNVLCDHIDRDGLNNTRLNLRPCSFFENNTNMPIRSDNTSGHKGVTWCKETSKWRVQVWRRNKKICGGRFDTLEEAATAYGNVVKRLAA